METTNDVAGLVPSTLILAAENLPALDEVGGTTTVEGDTETSEPDAFEETDSPQEVSTPGTNPHAQRETRPAIEDIEAMTDPEEMITAMASLGELEYLKARRKFATKLGISASGLDKIINERKKGLGRNRDEKPASFFEVKDDGLSQGYADGSPSLWIGSRIEVIGRMRDKDGENHKLLVMIEDSDGIQHKWQMPMEALAGDGTEVFRALLNRGAKLSPIPSARRALLDYLGSVDPQDVYRTVVQTGWINDCYVLPDMSFPADSEEQYIYEGSSVHANDFEVKGSVEDWVSNIGSLCRGNTILTLAVSAAYAAPLLYFTGLESGGINIQGASSTGKTTALKVAASVIGSRSRVKKWRATANGLEGVAEAHNDCLLCIDELGQLSGKEAGEVAYMLANGHGKQRSSKDGSPRRVRAWRILFLSAGEVSLSTLMNEGGKTSRAGQELRFIDLKLGLTGGTGIIEELHGRSSGDLVHELDRKSREIYGAPMRAFLENVSQIGSETLEKHMAAEIDCFVKEVLPDARGKGQIERVALRFGMIAAAGELASSMGLTGWEHGEAKEATAKLFRLWMEQRESDGPSEKDRILAQVREFFQRNGTSRFYILNMDGNAGYPEREISNCAGYVDIDSNGTEHLVFRDVFRTEICAGFEYRDVCRVLAEEGILQLDSKGGFTTPKSDPRVPGHKTRFYVLKNASGLEVDPEEQAERERWRQERDNDDSLTELIRATAGPAIKQA